jgi:uncharacterized SAM-binding protein YcdF (DUF218 family)
LTIRRILVCVIAVYGALLAFFSYQVHLFSHCPLPAHTDAVIVVTGQIGRIEAGEKLLQQYQCPLFISGVGSQVQVTDVVKTPAVILRVVLGHHAKNTAENGQEIEGWVQHYRLQSMIVISHNYHLPRLLLYLESIPNLTIYPHAVTAYLSTGRFLIEMHKYYYSLFHLIFA